MKEKITLDMLTNNSVSVVRQNVAIIDGMEYEIGMKHRCAYENTEEGIKILKVDVPEPYCSTVLNLWSVEQ